MSQTDTSISDYLNALRKSTMFHMSLGSKELFHSNFLHWISIVNWSAFLKIMHGLADTEKFWWEKIDEKDPHKCPEDIKVFREHRNFDLSIYILDSEKEVVDNSNYNKVENDDNTTEYTQDSKGKRKVQKWIPVLILENKMKSLPYKAQLEEYTKKAFEEWSSGKDTKMKLKARAGENKQLVVNPNDKYSITFIVLSLKGTLKLEDVIPHSKNSKNPKNQLTLNSKWIGKTYKDLLGQLKDVSLKTSLDNEVLKDYCKFVEAICGLADKWTITSDMKYRSQIFPWGINGRDAEEKIEEINNYKELRIHDIHEKLLYDQLLNMLEIKLKENGFKFRRFNAKTNQNDINNNIKIFTNSNYAHGIGIVEAFFVINNNFKLFLQVQGDRYCHMVIHDKIVKKDMAQKKKLFVNTDVITSEPIKKALSEYISIDNSSPTFPWNVPSSWGKYGEGIIYQFVLIPETAFIGNVIEEMIKDLQKIEEIGSNIKSYYLK